MGGGDVTLQALLDGGTPVGPGDPVDLFRHLASRARFHRDTGFGRIFHPGRLSFRENRPTDSLHVVIDGDHVAAHVDRVSPLSVGPAGRRRYSLPRAAAHNLVGVAQDLIRLPRGRQGDHRSELDCEWLWGSSGAGPDEGDQPEGEAVAWSVQLEAQLGGRLDETRLRAALAVALGRRPLDHDPVLIVQCDDDEALDAARASLDERPATTCEWPPFRAALARRPDGDAFLLWVNHAAADGFGALALLGTVASAYATGSAPPAPLDVPAVAELPVRPASAPVSAWMTHYSSAVERLRDVLARPARLAPEGAREDARYGFHRVCLSIDDTLRVVDVDRPGTSRNVLLAALHRAIGEWNLRHGAPGRRVGVLVPVNLRPPEWPEERLGNFSVTARVSTSRRHRSGATAALEAVTAQTTRNKRARTGIALLAALERAGLLPLWCKQSLVVLRPLTRNRLVDTALLANLGWLDQAPSFGDEAGEMLHVWFSSPARSPQTLCVGAVTVSGRLHLVLRYPLRLFGADGARRFADCLVAELQGVGDRHRPTGPRSARGARLPSAP